MVSTASIASSRASSRMQAAMTSWSLRVLVGVMSHSAETNASLRGDRERTYYWVGIIPYPPVALAHRTPIHRGRSPSSILLGGDAPLTVRLVLARTLRAARLDDEAANQR